MTISSRARIQRLAGIACLGALAFVLMLFEFPIIPVASYLKLDFSDVPVLLGTALYGPVSGIIIAVIKCLVHAMVYGFSVGELLGVFSDFISSLSLILPFAWVFKKTSWKPTRRYLVGTLVSTVVMTVIMSLLNLWVLTPLYMQIWGWKPTLPISQLVAIGVVPFNIIKGLLIGVVFSLLAARLNKWLEKRRQY